MVQNDLNSDKLLETPNKMVLSLIWQSQRFNLDVYGLEKQLQFVFQSKHNEESYISSRNYTFLTKFEDPIVIFVLNSTEIRYQSLVCSL